MKRLVIVALIVAGLVGDAVAQPRPSSATKPEGEMRWALYVTLAPAWFDPGEVTGGFLTPFWVLYALHDALVKPMPGQPMAPSLAESWTGSTSAQRGAAGRSVLHEVAVAGGRGERPPDAVAGRDQRLDFAVARRLDESSKA